MSVRSLVPSLRSVLLLVGVATVAFVAVVAAAFLADTGGEERTIRGLTVAGREAGNLDRTDLDAVLDDIEAELQAETVEIDMPDGTRTLPAGELGIGLDRPVVARRAMDAGAADDLPGRFRTWLGSFTVSRSVSIAWSYDAELAAAAVARLDGLRVAEPVEPRLVLSPGRTLTVRSGSDGRRVDEAAVVDRLGHQVEAGGPFSVDAPTVPVPPQIDEAELAGLAEELNAVTAGGVTIRVADEERTIPEGALRIRLDTRPDDDGPSPEFDVASLQRLIEHTFGDVVEGGTDPVFEVVDGEPVLVEEGTLPVECCAEDAGAEVAAAVLDDRPGPVVVDPRPTEDERLVAWSEGEGIEELVAEFTTNHSCCQGRVDNIQQFADIVRGVHLLPGESLSLNGHVGQRTREKGFVPAGTILSGRLVPTVGGGVSQFATTMFNAAFFAGFDFEAYQSHSIYFSRYPYGREATISWPQPDLEFTNTTDHPALIWTSYTDTSITVSVYSTPSVEVEQTGQQVSSARQCTRVDTFRLRTYEDGRTVEDSVFATYRPGEGLDCNGNPTPQPDV